MPVYLSPGVYIEEIPSGAKPIEGVATSVAAFVGPAPRGPAGEANLIQKLDDYKAEYGDIASEDDAMGLSVQAFYLNGGKPAYICRLVGAGSTIAAGSVVGAGTAGTPTTDPVLLISSKNEGTWGNDLHYRVVKPDSDALNFTLEVGHREDGAFVVDESLASLTMRADDDAFAPNQVNNESALVTLALGASADPDASGEQYQNATLRGGQLDDTDATYFSAALGPSETLMININGRGAESIFVDLTGASLAGTHNADGDAVALAINNSIHAHNTLDVFQNASCTYDTGTHRFVLTSAEDESAASLEVYAGTFAELLRLDRRTTNLHRAELTGAQRGSGGTVFNSSGSGLPSLSDTSLTLDIDNHNPITITLDVAALGLQGVNAADGAAVALAIQNGVQGFDPEIAAYKDFTCSYDGDRHFVLTSGSDSPRRSGLSVTDGPLAVLLGLDAAAAPTLVLGRELDQGTARVIPLQSLGTLEQGVALIGGSENPPTANDYADFYGQVLRKVRDVTMIVTPGATWNADGPNPIVSNTLAHAEAMRNRMVLIDPPPGLELADAGTVDAMSLPTSTYSVLYYPWVRAANPFFNADTNPTAPKTLLVAPSAYATGLWTKTDGRRGVWKAPAGVEARLIGAAGLEYTVEDGEQGQLNPLGINCYRKIPSFGPVIWGSRTLSTKANPEWRYVPVRRTAIFIEQSIYNGIQWAVFEPNDHPLWSSLRANIGAFMNGLFRANAFQGKTADDAYFVRCNLGDTMTQGDIDRGQVIVIVGFAPLKPAEFVIVRIQQKVGQQ